MGSQTPYGWDSTWNLLLCRHGFFSFSFFPSGFFVQFFFLQFASSVWILSSFSLSYLLSNLHSALSALHKVLSWLCIGCICWDYFVLRTVVFVFTGLQKFQQKGWDKNGPRTQLSFWVPRVPLGKLQPNTMNTHFSGHAITNTTRRISHTREWIPPANSQDVMGVVSRRKYLP